MTARERADELRALHLEPGILVMVNAWDVASARTVAALPGCRAVATASWAIAAAHGVRDGERIDRATMLAAVGRIAAAVPLPVSADLEAGYGAGPQEVGETVALAIEAGAVGCNLEDARGGELLDVEAAARRIDAARAAGDGAGVRVVINARTDAFVHGHGLDTVIARGRAYREAGADCIFCLGVQDRDDIAVLVREMGAPISVLATPSAPSVRELQELGVARVSFGPGPMGVALAALDRVAADLLRGGAPHPDLAFRPPVG